jgi:hypothetical protein
VGETWRTPYGVSVTLRYGVDPSTGVASRALALLDVRSGEQVHTIDVSRAERVKEVVFGVPLRIVNTREGLAIRQVQIDARQVGQPPFE